MARRLDVDEPESGDLASNAHPGYVAAEEQVALSDNQILDSADEYWFMGDRLAGALNLTEPA
jgi:hypothetical protein